MHGGTWQATVYGVKKESDMTQQLHNKSQSIALLGKVSEAQWFQNILATLSKGNGWDTFPLSDTDEAPHSAVGDLPSKAATKMVQ